MSETYKYVISGKGETFKAFCKDRQEKGVTYVYSNTLKIFNTITPEDTIVLLQGWWGRSWAKEAIIGIELNYPNIKIEYLDGKFGEDERKSLKSDRVHDRFELLDL